MSKEPAVFPLSPSLILPDSRGEFTLYLKQGGKLVLYTKKGEVFTRAHRARLMESGVKHIYTQLDEKHDYDHYVQDNLGALLSDEDIPLEERASAWYGASVSLVQDVFEEKMPKPLTKSRFNKIKSLVKASVSFFKEPESLKELARFITRGYGLYHHGIGTMVLTCSVLNTYDRMDKVLLVGCATGAILHDIGRTQFPAELNAKDPGTLTEEEWTIVKSHPAVGVSMCSQMPLMQESLHCILFHHEESDGSGYPSGALDEHIPFYCKVLNLCNKYDNLTRSKGYRPAFSPFEALKLVKAQQGFYEPEMLKRLILVLSRAELT